MRIRTNVIILGILFISAYAGNYLGLGDRFWWLDVALHFLGGFFIAVLIREYYKSHLEKMAKPVRILFLVASVALVGLLWEFYEYLVWTFFDRFPQWDLFNIGFDLPDYFDALSDLLMDLLGTIALVLLNKKSD
ncbi:MAG: hypothetical protein A2750_00160 [Candidatus Yanofskybacteria bacterium RIFCSPHIGHO2_01_FULL_45_42]|uniref:Uncharacterized protein n=3 Tax=Candidatus Yanofskyibacteriota TaxID=1752733 RepID=A0A1F8F3Z2_9BACT|nr:MAG: hypothetical protein A2750_00160 [Candidatus Yanofskybacteria bacterium RIFCSPHIGHO2_01_FULL_45_42]OGN15861.1 MAG: hypothetical protein A3C81_02085 [Candidatus Yanofskybacteria bacterium RIFCSPHIGHO2_02_FULL_46_19]OGN27438.1 MAG: hypothetical protein A3B17_01540 [Candidatus Yanofskybacteria bacterium RIFCSPLOWO2_01_FULL_45_72]OGN32299.1 MAG: hypothetical protein A3J01_02450 [Candidatus Yanofskybacteria bacterium RIFCSPLOWO2_02_FULL_45_18]